MKETIRDVQGNVLDHEPVITRCGRTLVYADRQGPYKFVRDGKEVPCVCDPKEGIVCQYHTRERERRSRSQPGNTGLQRRR